MPARTIRPVGLTFGPRRRRIWRVRNLIIGVVVIVLGAGAFLALGGHRSGKPAAKAPPPGSPAGVVDAFLNAWAKGDPATMASLVVTPAAHSTTTGTGAGAGTAAEVAPPPPDLVKGATSLLRLAPPGSRASFTRTGLRSDATSGTATYHARVDLAGFGPFSWNDTLPLVRVRRGAHSDWRVEWKPADLYPGLAPGEHLSLVVTWPPRAPIVAADGTMLAGSQPIVTIGLEPDRILKSLPQIKQKLASLIGTDPASIDTALHAPGVQPNYFVPIATVPDDTRYTTVLRPQLAPIPGVFFHKTQGVLSVSGLLSSQLVGSVGDITAERLHQLGPPYRVGDQVGLSGLQASYETRLAGRPTATVAIVGGPGPAKTLAGFPGRAPVPVHITIDPHLQQAAEAALAGETLPAGLVALDTATGQIRAAVSKPDTGFNRALDGAYPPGSTFKVVTSTALLEAGRTGTTPAPCPPTITVDGRVFKNFEGEAAGAIDLAHAFAISCNNAFIGLADQLPPDALGHAAAAYGFNARWSLPVPSFGGSYPKPKDGAERAASAIGQGRVLASPVQMASVAAAVASGHWRDPVLTTDPAPPAVSAAPLDAGVVATLRSFMAGVVAPGGTAAGAGLPPGVFAKTGTAEFGPANPPQTHAWFIGYRGSIAFAVIVEGGGVGGRVAAPLAAKFLAAFPG